MDRYGASPVIERLYCFLQYFLYQLPAHHATPVQAKVIPAYLDQLAGPDLLLYFDQVPDRRTLYLHWFGIHNYFRGTTATFYVIDNVYFAGSIIIASILFWTIETWMQSEKEKMALQQEKINAELSFLKSQVNPHFLFNTLNNIYSLVYHKSDKSLPAILKLSELMRYMTRESDADHIQLSKEIQYIKNFIELQLLRTSENACVQFTLHGEPDNMNIAPLLLIPFIENGFKHGLVTDEHAPFIITISIINKNLTLYTHNKIRTGQKDHSGGVGLQNVKRRLELLYPDRHELQIQHTSEEYSCTLLIKL